LSATADVVFGTKNTFNAAIEVNASTLLKADNKALLITNRLTNLETDVTTLKNSPVVVNNNVTNVNMAVLFLFT
jgi:hypothetical protein